MAERKAYLLRLPAELLEELNRWARDDLRSLNAQIEFVLREAVRNRRRRTIEAAGTEEDRSALADKQGRPSDDSPATENTS
jgi:hypothetical protein